METIRGTFSQLIICAGLALSVTFTARESCAQAAAPAKEILLGQSMDLSGPAAPRQKLVKEAADAYIKYVNARGGVNGRKVRVITLDNHGAKEDTVTNVTTLVEKDKVFALFLVSGTSNVIAVLPYLEQARVPLFGVTTGSVSLRKPHPYLFHYKASYANETARIAEHLALTGMSRIGIIYLRNGFGKEGLAAAEAGFAARKLTVVAKADVAEDGSDAPAAAKIVAAGKPQAVVLISVSGPAPKIVQAYRALDEDALLCGLSVLSSDALYAALGDKVRGMVITQTVPYPWSGGVRVVTSYREAMKAAGVKDISPAGFEGYLAARMLVEALKIGGKDMTRDNFVKILENTGDQDFGGFHYSFSAGNHEATHFVDITLIGKGGKLLH